MAESFFPDFGLLWYLEELKKEEFWRFKELLKQEPLKFGLKPVPWSELKKASREDLAKLLNNYYADKQAWLLTRNIFLQINRRDLWEKAHEEMRITVNPYRERMKEKFRLIWEHETRLPVPENFYIDTVKVEYEVMKNLFTFKETSEDSFTIVLKGPEGIGKTTLLRRAMLEWAEGNFWKDRFPFVFFLDAREMHHAQQTSLVEFISKDWPETCEPIETIFSQPQAILFIIDGSEELTFNLTVDDKACSDWRQRHTMEAILSGLLQRMMLPTCSLMIAVDSDDVKKNVLLRHPNSIIVPAFSELERKKYFFHFFREKYKATKAFSFVRENRFLLSICQKPLLCQLICHSLKWQLERGEELHVAHLRKTSVYASFLVSVAKAVGANSSPGQSRAQLQGLCSLAAEGVWTHTYVFGHVDLRRNRLSASDVMTWVGLHLLRRNGDSVTFFHRSVQDFCAALYYLLKQPQDPHHSSIHSVAELVLRGLCRVEIRLSQMRRFLFGLSTDKMAKVLGASAGFELAQEIIRCVQSIHQRNSDVAELDFQELFYSLNLKKMALCTENVFSDDSELEMISILNYCCLSSISCDYISEVLLRSKSLTLLDLGSNILHDSGVNTLCEALKNANCRLQELCNEQLRTLKLGCNDIQDVGVKQLCEGLKHPNCKLQTLGLEMCGLTNACSEDLASVLTTSKTLTVLNLDWISWDYNAVLVLCEALNHPDCGLQTLG
ncbi:NACHT, LRR and PYD domains-containing protein 9 [Rhynchocyon petersi]